MEELIQSMAQSGFSVAVAAYLLVRMERRLEDLTGAIRELSAWMQSQESQKSVASG